MCRTPGTAYTNYLRRVRETQARNFAQPFASHALSPCQTFNIQGVHAHCVFMLFKNTMALMNVCFNDPDFVPLTDRATTEYAVIIKRRNPFYLETVSAILAVISTALSSMHTPPCASRRNLSKRASSLPIIAQTWTLTV